MNNRFISDFLNTNEKEKNNNKILTIFSFLIGTIGLVIIMRLIDISLPKQSFSLIKKEEIKNR